MREVTMRAAIVIAVALAGVSLGGCGKAGDTPPGGPATAATSSPAKAAEAFRLREGLEHDVCGIGVVVKFIPATASSSKADFAVVYGGPVNKVEDKVQNHTGDEPLPANAAHAVAGTTITVYGKQFAVDGADPASSSVQLRPLC